MRSRTVSLTSLYFLFFLSLFLFALTTPVLGQSEEVVARQQYDSLLARLSPTKVNPHFVAVHLWQEKKGDWMWTGSGTLLLDTAGNPYRIITAGHIFSRKFPKGIYGYQLITPKEGIIHEIADGEPRFEIGAKGTKVETDVALLTPGPRRAIGSFSSFTAGFWGSSGKDVAIVPHSLMRRNELTSLTTGQSVPVLGEGWYTDGSVFYVLGYESFPGESGSGFVNDRGELYVLSSGIPVVEKLRTVLPLVARYKLISFASAVKITFPK